MRLFEDYRQGGHPGQAVERSHAEDREQIKEDLVRMELIAQQAEKDGLTKDRKSPRASSSRA